LPDEAVEEYDGSDKYFQMNKEFAKTVGVQDNAKYERCDDEEQLIINLSYCSKRSYVVKFVARDLCNYKIINENVLNRRDFYKPMKQGKQEDWDILWTTKPP
jgi:hypothetical protein